MTADKFRQYHESTLESVLRRNERQGLLRHSVIRPIDRGLNYCYSRTRYAHVTRVAGDKYCRLMPGEKPYSRTANERVRKIDKLPSVYEPFIYSSTQGIQLALYPGNFIDQLPDTV
jgi:hypothetical protein